MRVKPQPRDSKELRCAFCHGKADKVIPCTGCGTLLHQDCFEETKRCPTLGCTALSKLRRTKHITPPGQRPPFIQYVVISSILAVLALNCLRPLEIFRPFCIECGRRSATCDKHPNPDRTRLFAASLAILTIGAINIALAIVSVYFRHLSPSLYFFAPIFLIAGLGICAHSAYLFFRTKGELTEK